MPVEVVAALGWEHCARLTNDFAEVLVTLDVGPRILSYQLKGGENVLRTYPGQLGKSGEPNFQVRGGHRLWVAPEGDFTSIPDNAPTEYTVEQPNVVRAATLPAPPWQLRREMVISLAADTSTVMIEHSVTNAGAQPVKAASWGLTIMTPGGWAPIPQPPLGVHGREFLPRRVVVPWTYTDLSDSRWRIGQRFWSLTPDPAKPATKLGFAHREGWVGYILPRTLFIKAFNYEEGAEYPDLGSNLELFSKGDFIELETLSPYHTLAPGATVRHTEIWRLFAAEGAPARDDETALAAWLRPRLEQAGIFPA